MAIVKIFVGTPEDDVEELPYFYSEIQMTGIDLFIDISKGSIDNISAEDYLHMLATIMNKTFLVARQLKLPVVLDESIDDFAEEIEEGLAEKCHKVFREVFE